MSDPVRLPAKRLFVTGTDTDVGKTIVTACLAASWARSAPGQVRAIKPVASGVEPGDPRADAAVIARAAGHAPLCWLTLRDPVSPHRAQLRAGIEAEPDALLRWLADRSAPITIVEGAGGWWVPLLQRADGGLFEVPDLARAVGGSVVIVAADRLGVLNHTRLTVQAVALAGLPCAGVVLNRMTPADPSRDSNLDDLRALLPCPIATLEHLGATTAPVLADAGDRIRGELGLRG